MSGSINAGAPDRARFPGPVATPDAFFDRYGADPERWPAPAEALAGRLEAAAGWPAAKASAERLEARLGELGRRRAAEIEAAGSAQRIGAGLRPTLPPLPSRRAHVARWAAMAATLVLAFSLGSMVDLRLDPAGAVADQGEAMLGPPAIGPSEVGLDE
jgi:hypothetical protein